MNRKKLAFIAVACILCFACGDKTKVDFSIVPVMGSNGEYQYIDVSQKGKVVINPQFSEATIFRDGLALVKTSGSDGKWGYIDKKGKFVIPPVYSYAQTFGSGVAWVQMEDQPPMLIDKKGKMILQIDSLGAAIPFNHGISSITIYSKGKGLTMFINKKGEPAIAVAEEYADDINDGFYSFVNRETRKYGYKNKNGEITINPQFDGAARFFDGMAAVQVGEKEGAIDKKGDIIINPQYDNLRYDSDGLFRAKMGGKWGWVDKKGEIVVNPQFDNAEGYYGSKLAPVEMGGKYGYIDKKGQIVINPQFGVATPFNGDYAMVYSDGKVGFINKKGDFVVYPLYDLKSENFIEYINASRQNAIDFPVRYISDKNRTFQVYEKLAEKIREWEEEKAKKPNEGAEKEEEEMAEYEEPMPPTKGMNEAESDVLTDRREGKQYRTVKIGNQTWMAQNLNYEANGSVCYENNSANCAKYGRLYNWNTAKSACPSGWHLPSKSEWETLDNAVGGEDVAGKKLKAKSGWNDGGNGTDESGFSGVPGGRGFSDGNFNFAGNIGFYWSASEKNAKNAYYRPLRNDTDNVSWNADGVNKGYLFSVRCVKD